MSWMRTPERPTVNDRRGPAVPDSNVPSGRLAPLPAALVWLGLFVFGSAVFGSAVSGSASEPVPASEPIHASGAAQLRLETTEAWRGGLVLVGRDARLQLVISRLWGDDRAEDATGDVTFSVSPADVVAVDVRGVAAPLQAGEATLHVHDPLTGSELMLPMRVDGFDRSQPVNFPGQVVPVFTKLGCNGGGCHGKAAGQNGFRLSLMGFEPHEDFEHLVMESRGRRLFPAAPDQSLLLTKSIGTVPHGGGQRMEADSHEYRLLRRWIEQGMPYGSASDPVVVGLEVIPPLRTLPAGSRQQLQVVAHYSDGSLEDVTGTAQYESNDPEMAEVSVGGLVELRQLAGQVAIMTRFQGQVALFHAAIPAGPPAPPEVEPQTLVDEAVFAQLERLGIPLSKPTDDTAFLRRVSLDLMGRLPTTREYEAFIADAAGDKRQRWIDHCLEQPEYADYFGLKWSTILRNRRNNEAFQYGSFAFRQWIRDALWANLPYDDFVRQIVAASGSIETHPPVAWYRQVTDIHQQLEDTAQLFLGQRIQCARCHHHPFEKWGEDDYYGLAAYFSLVSRKPGGLAEEPVVFTRAGEPSAANPKTGRKLSPTPLGQPGQWEGDPIRDPRHQLVDWMADADNPFFAPSLVNRYWKHFFGRGLVDPEDDMRATNPASNPELLAALSESFIASGFDLKQLCRTICNSYTYQASSQAVEGNLEDQRNHARFYPKRLEAEVLLDALDAVTLSPSQFAGMPSGTRAVQLPDTGFENYFLTVFGRPDASTACECERASESNLAQSLHLLNSTQVQQKLADPAGRAALAAAGAPESDATQIQTLYRLALSREPDEEELQTALDYLGESRDRQAAYEDLVWAVINSKEFLFNH